MFFLRVIGATIMISLVLLSCFWLPNNYVAWVVSVLVFLALFEFYSMVQKKNIFIFKVFSCIVGMGVPLIFYFFKQYAFEVQTIYFVVFVLSLFVLSFTRKQNDDAVSGIGVSVLGMLYIACLLSFSVQLLLFSHSLFPNGKFIMLYWITVTKMGDIGAYLFGSRLGKNPLIPRLSPNKSIEGSIAGLVVSILSSLAFWFAARQIPFYHFIILGTLIGIVAQVGDLCESLIKRDCDNKDSGKFMPGLGGVMDIIDSLLFTAPLIYIYLKLFF